MDLLYVEFPLVVVGVRDFSRLRLWTVPWRIVVFILAASSIWCLLAEFYGLCPMQAFVIRVFLPASALLLLLGLLDLRRGDRQLARALAVGVVAGTIAAIAYDIFRLPFVFSEPWGLHPAIPSLPLFTVFPQFGAMILGEPKTSPSLAAHLAGWAYHVSNGMTFGIMYVALVGNPGRRHWAWGAVMALLIELAMLATPYPGTFGIRVTATFIAVTVAAHLIFGVALGQWARRSALRNWPAVSVAG